MQQVLRKRLVDVAAGLLQTGLTGLTEGGGARPTNAEWTMVAQHAHIYRRSHGAASMPQTTLLRLSASTAGRSDLLEE